MALLCVLALNVTSAFADAFTIANGAQPSVAVDQEGTAHVVWNQVTSETQADVLHYCEVPRGATSCQHEQTFVPRSPTRSTTRSSRGPGSSSSGPTRSRSSPAGIPTR